jgi:chromosome segregation protein
LLGDMFLRSLQIRAFKSFADKTAIEFSPGISVIVGPNGSGKSNLVDAISWVLGEQGPRALRGTQMADVIFAGGPERPALGMAEVKLVIDNSAGLIPVPLSELEISRTIFRSGDSEYRIGGRVVRLLDVQELLSESGIGRALHTIVSQGQLEDVLTARPEDRRRYIEEAAGVAKHRRRRERAERKLAGLDQDLQRLQDVLAELRRQLKPLKQQAEVARRHEELTAEADEVAVRLAAARLRELLAERDRRTADWEEGLARRKEARERLDALDERVGRAADERARAVWALQEAEGLLQGAQQEKSACELALRRALEAESAARTEFAAESARHVRLSALDEELGQERERLEQMVAELDRREHELEGAEREFRALAEARRSAEEERRLFFEETAARRAEMEALRRSLALYERDRARIAESLSQVGERKSIATAERDRLEAEIERLDAEVPPISERRAELERERRVLAGKVAELQDALRHHENRHAVLVARKQDLEETPGSRFLGRHRDRVVGLLGNLVESEPGWEKALSAGLGYLADAVVYRDEEDALADVRAADGAVLAVAGGGPASFVLPGERTLLQVVSADPTVRGLVCTVLKDVYLATSLEEAVAKHTKYPKASFVTPEGILVGPAVIRTAGDGDSRSAEVGREMRVVEHDLAQTRAALGPKRGRLARIVAELEELTEKAEGADAEITRAAEKMARLEADASSLASEEELLAQRLAGLDDAAEAWRESLAVAEGTPLQMPDLPHPAEPPVAQRVDVETLRRDRARLETRLRSLEEERRTVQAVDPAALRGALNEAEAEREAADQLLREASAALETISASRVAAAEVEREATELEADVNRKWREASAELEGLREEYESEDRARGDLDRRIRDAERVLVEGCGRDPQQAVGELSEEDTIQMLGRRAELIQRRLALLGRVNLLAGGEFEALRERHDFLARELDDVRKARRDLLEVIQRIDVEIAATLESAYRDVGAEFERLIRDLFPGGEGHLTATEPTDLLNTGIEIEARPARKRVRRISLLSGGERALTAMAFLFAIFKARPSPFYLMDEVEPALDDVNLHRFLRLVRSLAVGSQVLIVTHQKRTMEVARMMYGVSMGKDGTSKVVAQRLESADLESSDVESPEEKVLEEEVPTLT